MPEGVRRIAEKQIGVARAKRRKLTRAERGASLARARRAAAAAGLPQAGLRFIPLALSDSTHTYRVRGGRWSVVLKLMSPSTAASSLEAHTLLSSRGIALPAVRWASAPDGVILYEDAGSAAPRRNPDRQELEAVVTYLARLHAAGVVDPASDADLIPTMAMDGWPSAAEWAARLLAQVHAKTAAAQRELFDIVTTLAVWMTGRPRVVIGDIKREHFRFHGGALLLTDLELVSVWDVIPSNLATLLAFPGQFRTPIDDRLRRWLLERYAAEHDRLEGTRTNVEELDRAVRCAESLIAISIETAFEMDPNGLIAYQSAGSGVARTPGRMIRDRGLFTAASGLLSIEHELGPDLFDLIRARLNEPRSLRILDIGCGDGRALAQVARQWPWHFPVGVDRTNGLWRANRLRGDALALPIRDSSVDLAWSVQLLQYVPDKVACLAEVYRVLAPGGLAAFAMTEHVPGESAFVPPLAELTCGWSPDGVVERLVERRIGGRRVLTFAIGKAKEPLRGLQTLNAVNRSEGCTCDEHPYLQSFYDVTDPVGRKIEAALTESDTVRSS